MIINLRMYMANFSSIPTRNCLLIADTILIKGQTPEVLNRLEKKYADISYTIEENEDVDENENTNVTNTKPNSNGKS